MFERFTEKSIKALLLAEEEVRRMNHDHVGTEHVLLGLLREGTGSAAKSLKSHDVTLKEARLEVQRITSGARAAASGEASYTAAAIRLLGAAVRETQAIGADYIATEYLLLGLLADDHYENRALRVLDHFHIDLPNLKEQLTRTAVGDSIFYRRPPTERPRKRQPVSDEMVYQALRDAFKLVKTETEKEAADERVNQSLGKILTSLRKAHEIATSEERMELAAWISIQDRNLIEKFQEQGGSIFELGKMLEHKSEAHEREFARLRGLNMQALNVLTLAKEESHRSGHNYLGAEQILLGLIAEDNSHMPTVIVSIGGRENISSPSTKKDFGIAAKVLQSMGATVESARAELEKIIEPGTDLVMEEPPLTDGADCLFELARDEAQRLSPETERSRLHIGTEHLLLALMHEIEAGKADTTKKVFENLGIDLTKMKEHILRLEPDARLVAGFVSPRTIALSEEETRQLCHDSIGSEHIFLALIREGIGIASRSLKLVGVDIEAARAEVQAVIRRGTELSPEELHFGPSTRRLFELSREEAKNVGHGYLGTEHIILAIINRDDPATSIPMRVLKALNVDVKRLRYEVESRLMNLKTGITGENFLK